MVVENFDQNLPKNVTLIEIRPGIKIYLVGVDEFNKESKTLGTYVIQNVKPNSVVLGVCQSRFNMMKLGSRTLFEEAYDMDFCKIKSILDSYGIGNTLMYIASLKIGPYFSQQIGSVPGAEYQEAFAEASRLNSEIIFGDRPIHITMNRASSQLSFPQKLRLYWLLSKFREQQNDRKRINNLLGDIGSKFPNFTKIFIDERNTCFSHALKQSVKSNIVKRKSKSISVVGILASDHIPGVETLMYDPKIPDISDLMTVPPEPFPTMLLGNILMFSGIALGTLLTAKIIQ